MDKTARFLFALALFCGIVILAGCIPRTKSPTTTSSTGGSSSGNLDPFFGPVQAGRKGAQNLVTANEMRNIHIFINHAPDMPSKEQIMAAMKQEDPKGFQLIQDGQIILTGAKTREGVWAFEKDAPTKGGWVVTSSGPEKMSAQQLQQLLQNQP